MADKTRYGIKIHNFTEQWSKPQGQQYVILYQMAGYKTVDEVVDKATEWILNRSSI